MVDEKGQTILITGRRLRTRDRFLTADNDLYEVETVEGYLARARFIEKVDLKTFTNSAAGPGAASPDENEETPAYKIAIYHSHNAESYVPSDGSDSIYGAGGFTMSAWLLKSLWRKKELTFSTPTSCICLTIAALTGDPGSRRCAC